MSWHFSQALVEAYSAGHCSDGEQSAPSSGTPTHGTFWSPGKTTDVLKPSRSGMTFKPLTDDHGEAVLMSYLEAFPVRTFPVQEKERESKENEAPCGNTWQESSAKFDLASSSWKTHQCLWEEDLPSSSLILPKWGMMRSGVLWERITPPLLTSGTESGSWPTPTRNDAVGGIPKIERESLFHFARGSGGDQAPASWESEEKRQVKWPNPCARDHKGVSGSGRQAKRGNPQDTLCNAVAGRMWPTPDCRGFTNDGSLQMLAKKAESREEWSAMGFRKGRGAKERLWPTPSAHKQTASGDLVNADGTPWDGESKPHSKKTGKPVQTALLDRVKMFPTPGANEDSYRLAGNSQQSNGLGAMARREALEQDPVSGGQLNPTWVEWLMGWPLGWTDCAALVTDKFQQWQRSHGIS
jgi:hypothetical protein